MKTKSSLPVRNVLGYTRPDIDPTAISCQFTNSEIFSVVAPFIYKRKLEELNMRKHQKQSRKSQLSS